MHSVQRIQSKTQKKSDFGRRRTGCIEPLSLTPDSESRFLELIFKNSDIVISVGSKLKSICTSGKRNNTVTTWRDTREGGREKEREGGDSFCGGDYIGRGRKRAG